MTPLLLTNLGTVLMCYAVGCCSLGYWLVRQRTGRDLRLEGSGNVGARNAARVAGKSAGLLTFGWDAGKGALAVLLARYLGLSPEWVMVAMLAVVSGHIWPLPLRFQGGKGVATAIGALGAFDGVLLGVCIAMFAVLWVASRHFEASGFISFVVLPGAAWVLGRPAFAVWGFVVLVAMLLWAHRDNIFQSRVRGAPGQAEIQPP